MAEGYQPPTVSRHGRQIKPTHKMAQLLQRQQAEIDLLTTKLEITKLEQEIVNMSSRHITNAADTPNRDLNNLKPRTVAFSFQNNTDAQVNYEMNKMLPKFSSTPLGEIRAHGVHNAPPDDNMPYLFQHNVPSHVSSAHEHYASANLHSGQEQKSRNHQSCQEQQTSSLQECLSETFKHLSNLMARQERLPRMEPETFSGDILKFPTWIRSFEALIERHTESPQDRLYYLGKYTAGEAKLAINGYLSLNDPETYYRAKGALQLRYGDQFKLAEHFKQTLKDWPTIKSNDGPALQRLADFLQHCNAAMASISHLKVLDNPDENRAIIRKLPQGMADRWNRNVDRCLYDGDGRYPTFATFCEFLMKEARIACGPAAFSNSPAASKKQDQRPHKTNATTFATDSTTKGKEDSTNDASTDKRPAFCHMCKGQHHISTCDNFKSLNYEERVKLVSDKGICFGCLRRGHMKKDCRRQGRPLFLIGLPPKQQTADVEATSHKTIADRSPQSDVLHSMVLPVTVHHRANPQVKVTTYALLDNQSNACFMSVGLARQLKAPKDAIKLRLTTMSDKRVVSCDVLRDLVIKGVEEEIELDMPSVYTRDNIPADESLIPRKETVEAWPHLSEVVSKLVELPQKGIQILIGFNCSSALLPKEVISAGNDEPYAIRTAIGWGVVGNMTPQHTRQEKAEQHFSFRTLAQEVNPMVVGQMFDREFAEADDSRKMSVNDAKFIEIVQSGIRKTDDGHYEVPLPMAHKVTLPNNKEAAGKRLMGVKRRMLRDDSFREKYMQAMNKMIDAGHAERVPETISDSTKWYIPHHGVYHPRKRDKLRIVFDCSAEASGESLNRHLLSGPDLINNLAGVLCRFRRERVALVCDIEAMFHQVKVPEHQRDFLRFLWFDDENKIKEFRMTVHLFGAVSSPGCVNYALKETAREQEKVHGKDAASFVTHDFYVDDGLTSVQSHEEAKKLLSATIKLCNEGGFKLHKIKCTDQRVIDDLPSDICDTNIASVNLMEKMPTTRTLGLEWEIQSDIFKFKPIEERAADISRRKILSTVSSIFDPLGLISPILLEGRLILQTLCRDGLTWDDEIPDDMAVRWRKWLNGLQDLGNISIARNYRRDIGDIMKVEMHHFSDASLTAYGVCSYLKLVDSGGRCATTLVMAKSRVNPSKPITVPRLELTAAVLAVKVASFLNSQLSYAEHETEHFFWTDSKVVLGYINNASKRFHMFVANRVLKIRAASNPKQWHYIGTAENPADLTSRGMTVAEALNNKLWWHGPECLKQRPDELSEKDYTVHDSDPEVRRVVTMTTKTESVSNVSFAERFRKFSSWNSLRRAIAVCIQLKKLLRSRASRSNQAAERAMFTTVSVGELEEAERQIVKITQETNFPRELRQLRAVNKEGQTLRKDNRLLKLDPFIDGNGVIRVGGRLKRSSMSYGSVHPVILARECHIAELITRHFHEKCGHSGANTTVGEMRAAGFWIIRSRALANSLINKCVVCKALRGKSQIQKMADLPEDRLEPAAPFTYSAVDLFGPFMVKEGRSQRKRWGAMFVCMVTRAVHIEVVATLSTDSFINAYRRFVSRRGPVRQLRCDRGTNFVGARNEFDDETVKMKLAKDGCDYDTMQFKFNFPHCSHMGGVWERMIRSSRNALSAILATHPCTLDDELLHTFLVESEAIVNSRPLVYMNGTDPDNSHPLTPAQMLTLKDKVVMPPPGDFVREDLYCRKRWRKVQFLADQFWRRWIKEFLPTLQTRPKWHRTEDNLQVGDIVLVTEELAARSRWPKGRVMETVPSEDGCVRKVRVKTHGSLLERPIHKLVFLYRPVSQN